MSAPLIGIFGSGRNGSTLLMRLLDGSPELWVHPIELNYRALTSPATLLGKLKRSIVSEQGDAVRAKVVQDQLTVLQQDYLDKLEQPTQLAADASAEILKQLNGQLEHDLPTFLQATQSQMDIRNLPQTPAMVFKSIEVEALEAYEKRFPEMRFVHIVRDPITNYTSLKRTDLVRKRKPFWFQGGDILRLQLERRWIPHARFIEKRCAQEPNKHYLVQYEALCQDPKQAIEDLCAWAGVLPPEDASLQTVLGGRKMRELPSNPSQEGVASPERVVADMAGQFGYEDVLTDREKDFILLRTHKLARALGYLKQPEGSLSRLGLAKEWLLPDKWERMNVDSKGRFLMALLSRRGYILSQILVSESRKGAKA